MIGIRTVVKDVPHSSIQRLLCSKPDTFIHVYSYQGQDALSSLEENGFLSGNAKYIEENGDWPDAYRWMRDQMVDRITDFSGDYPVWAWIKRPSTKNAPRIAARGLTEPFRIIAKVPLKRVLLSDYHAWHGPLNDSPVARTEQEFEQYDGDHRLTWHRVFEFTPAQTLDEKDWLGHGNRYVVQACIDRIYKHEIVSIKDVR